ncbi:hypothetical protein BDF20DRAFT_917367 [Mycotypha africana]|uniref:uncharacterized protein n=1 Tax=Mycotypha africana TaxID=64632 RepID=UPI002300BD23|nr:uncharacterized protein BDF20DRAFT_917367 [Mycotypha africana]KAI8967764.1 hypothetical protein BDF20DRAFT_917367 [Mycotypha africana]
MKFSSLVVFGLGVFVASCAAACDCKASDQSCLDQCVIAANECIVGCRDQGVDCHEACIANNWPAMHAMPKDVLAEATGSSTGSAAGPTPTGGEEGKMVPTAAPTGSVLTASMSGAKSMSGGSSGSSRPSATGSMSGGGMTKPTTGVGSGTKLDNANPSSDACSHTPALLGWSVAMMAFVGSTAWML